MTCVSDTLEYPDVTTLVLVFHKFWSMLRSLKVYFCGNKKCFVAVFGLWLGLKTHENLSYNNQ